MVPTREFCVTKPGSCITSKDGTKKRLNHAIQFDEQAQGSLLIKQAAKLCAISKTILDRKINAYRNQ